MPFVLYHLLFTQDSYKFKPVAILKDYQMKDYNELSQSGELREANYHHQPLSANLLLSSNTGAKPDVEYKQSLSFRTCFCFYKIHKFQMVPGRGR
jgi:hypothetical protein